MNSLYDHSFDEPMRARLNEAVERTRETLGRDDLPPEVRELLQEWAEVGSRSSVLVTEVNDLSILYSSVVDHASRVENELMRRNGEISQFLAGMSHEFRTPLNAIIGYCEMVLETVEEEGLDHVARDIRNVALAGRHMLSLTNDVLDISKVEAGQLELVPESVQCRDLVQAVCATMAALASEHRNHLSFHVDPAIGRIRVDPLRVRQCLTNLLGNACKFTEDGEIQVRVERGPTGVDFKVIDTGIGMSPEQQRRLFRAFSQATATTAHRYGGTGLGLALSLRLANMMGGTIEVESELGRGSTFVLGLPSTILEPPA